MKLGFDAKRFFNNVTGLGNYSRSLLHNLRELYPENEYHLFSPEIKETYNSQLVSNFPNFKIHVSKKWFKSYWRSFSIVKDLSFAGINLYHGLSNELPHSLNKNGIKSIVTIHDLIFKIYPKTYSITERFIYNIKFKYACKNADKIIAISENTKRDIIRFYQIDPSKIKVIYQTCNPSFYTLKSEDENGLVLKMYSLPKEYFLYVGSIEKRKNLRLIIEAYKIRFSEIKIPLVIVGKGGKYKNKCKRIIRKYDLDNYFIWYDKLHNNEHLQSFYQQAKGLIYPSFYEGFGLPIAEALLSKIPVIAANTSSLTEAGGPDSIYINPKNNQQLADAMIRLLNEDELAEEMIKKGFIYAHQNFGINNLTSKMMQTYQEVLKK